MKILVTGGAGFIGSAYVRHAVLHRGHSVVNLDKLTYAGNLESLAPVKQHPAHTFVQGDIGDRRLVSELLATHRPQAVVHLAAESHVDRSIDGPAPFIETNIVGTYELLEACLGYYRQLRRTEREAFRFHHVSTDEVYGSLPTTGLFTERTPYAPNSPYSASKAAADHLARAWSHTFGLPVIMTNCSNNYGPYQFPEKLIPLTILNAMEGKNLPIYGRGENVRDWLYVDDHVEGLMLVLERGRAHEQFNIGGRAERCNLDVVKDVCRLMDELQPDSPYRPHDQLIQFVEDRPGHDLRYAMDTTKIQEQLGWAPRESFDTGLRKTVEWYLCNKAWCDDVQAGTYRRERLGKTNRSAA